MSRSSKTTLAINVISHKGEQFLHEKWQVFVSALRAGLQQAGRLSEDSLENLLVYKYNHPFTAFASCLESIEKAKNTVSWDKDMGLVPIQIVLHLETPPKRYEEMLDASSDLWNFLGRESIYLSRSLKSHWEQLVDGKDLPPAVFDDEANGVYLLKFSEPVRINVERIFPHRGLALSGQEKECFYCGRTDHVPSKCPSKLMGMGVQGLPMVGYLSFPVFAKTYEEVFAKQKDMLNRLAAGVNSVDVKAEPALQVYLSYFDLFRVYQPRFLYHIAFTHYQKWEEIGRLDKVRVDNNSLNMGLDCLRVRQYPKAHKWLSSDGLREAGKEFYGIIGLAFLALEQGREKDMGTLLERAADLASSEKEYIYAGLLLARYNHLTHDLWKADQEASNALTVHGGCVEAKFAKIKIAVASGFADRAFALIEPLIKESREYFWAVLVDSALIPIQGLAEEALAAYFQNLGRTARESFVEVNNEWDNFKTWLGDKGVPEKSDEETVNAIRQHYERKSFFDLLKVCSRAKSVVASCHRNRRELLESLDKKLKKTLSVWGSYHQFWQEYPYGSLFNDFVKMLNQVNGRIINLQQAITNNKKLLYGDAVDEFNAIKEEMSVLRPRVEKMVWTRETIDMVKNYLKKLCGFEIVINVLAFILISFFNTVASDALSGQMKSMLSDPWFHKKIYLISSILVAPILAFMTVLWEKKDEIGAEAVSELKRKSVSQAKPRRQQSTAPPVDLPAKQETPDTAVTQEASAEGEVQEA